MSKISDELRKWCDLCGGIIDSGDKAELHALVDRIDAETVELPKDANGVPIHVSDPVFSLRSGAALFVSGILMEAPHVRVRVNNGKSDDWYTTPNAITHTRPDSLERIADELDEMVDAADSADDRCEKLADLADRIRKLAKEES